MDSDDMRLDGNMAAGALGELFPFDMSMVETGCAGCGRVEPAGAEVVYADPPGLVMRCVHCDSVLLTVVHDGGRTWLNMPGVIVLPDANY